MWTQWLPSDGTAKTGQNFELISVEVYMWLYSTEFYGTTSIRVDVIGMAAAQLCRESRVWCVLDRERNRRDGTSDQRNKSIHRQIIKQL